MRRGDGDESRQSLQCEILLVCGGAEIVQVVSCSDGWVACKGEFESWHEDVDFDDLAAIFNLAVLVKEYRFREVEFGSDFELLGVCKG